MSWARVREVYTVTEAGKWKQESGRRKVEDVRPHLHVSIARKLDAVDA